MPYIYIYVAINYLNTDIATFIALIYPLVLIPLMDYSNDKRTGKNILIYHHHSSYNLLFLQPIRT